MSTDSLVRKISSRLYYLACYHFFFRFLTLRGHIKEKLAFRYVSFNSSRFLQVPNSWPSRGQLTFRNVSLVYR